ncbi:MAG: GNAT family N-acetyltransferase [Myxococcales bacterium]|nr:GNAT family N-acetyltransferase [Myxococcales bacterium]
MYTLRLATPADAGFLLSLYVAHREAEVAGWGLPPAAIPLFLAQQHAARTASFQAGYPTAVDQVIARDGADVGRLLLHEAPDHLRVVDVALLPAAQGQGLGTRVLRDLQARGRPLYLSVAVDNPAARLYARLGFRGSDDGVYASLAWTP